MAVTVAQVKTALPEFCNVDNAVVQLAIDQADECINRPEWGENRADIATKYLAGHFLIFLDKGNALPPGQVTSEAEGQLRASYAVDASAKRSTFESTAYGRQYLELRRTAFPSRLI